MGEIGEGAGVTEKKLKMAQWHGEGGAAKRVIFTQTFSVPIFSATLFSLLCTLWFITVSNKNASNQLFVFEITKLPDPEYCNYIIFPTRHVYKSVSKKKVPT